MAYSSFVAPYHYFLQIYDYESYQLFLIFFPTPVAIIIFFVNFITWYTSALGILHLMCA